MSAEKVLDPKSAENLAAEDGVLDAIQTANALTMSEPIGDEELSIADKVRKRLAIRPNQAANLTVSVGEVQDEEHKPAGERIWIKAEIQEPTRQTVKQIRAARLFEGTILPEAGLTDEEAIALSGMVKGLQLAKEIGVLTQLDSSLNNIEKPLSDREKLPPLKK